MKYIFGPVASHRLGLSLGLDLIPRKTCNFNCIYCELGPTRRRTARRAAYVPAAEIINEVGEALATRPRPSVLTLCGSGEPTLNSQLGAIIDGLKGFGIPVALLSNGSLFTRAEVRREALAADIIMPSLDAADDATLARVNRPLAGLTAQGYARGLKELRGEFGGRLLLEVMLVAGVNDSPAHLERLATLCRDIHPDRVQLTTVLRPPAEEGVRALDAQAMDRAAEVFVALAGCPVDKPGSSGGLGSEPAAALRLEDELLALIERRPATAVEAARALGAASDDVSGLLERLRREGALETWQHLGQPFYVRRPVRRRS
jgi:wyosine [tRNA(Phe)-imidazoG37] synthetase (radical SAM superfamily)